MVVLDAFRLVHDFHEFLSSPFWLAQVGGRKWRPAAQPSLNVFIYTEIGERWNKKEKEKRGKWKYEQEQKAEEEEEAGGPSVIFMIGNEISV